jgi:NTP pyrophosphatase (non-canonical NTP hydrolase)
MNRLTMLAQQCAATHAPKDILEHLEEECLEVLTAIKAWRRGRGTVKDVIEECCDVRTEITTFFQLLENEGYITKSYVSKMETVKLDKFESMLAGEYVAKESVLKISRYHDPIEEFIELRPKGWNT